MRLAHFCGFALAALLAGGVNLGLRPPPHLTLPFQQPFQQPVQQAVPQSSQQSARQIESDDYRSTELAATLATGRVYILIAKNGIVVGALGAASEPGSLPPRIVPMEDRKLGIVLGAFDWKDTDTGQQLASFAHELPALHPLTGAAAPQLDRGATDGVAPDIEMVGLGGFDRLRKLAEMLHGPLQIPPGQSVLQIILTDYVQDYGPEIWTLDYLFQQEEMRPSYFETRAIRPRYMQLWPPEKGQPHSLVALSYPPSNAATMQSELLRAASGATGGMENVRQAIQSGDTRKIDANDAIAFLRAALSSMAASPKNFALAAIGEKTGFTWIVEPPAPQGPAKPRPPGAPSLVKP